MAVELWRYEKMFCRGLLRERSKAGQDARRFFSLRHALHCALVMHGFSFFGDVRGAAQCGCAASGHPTQRTLWEEGVLHSVRSDIRAVACHGRPDRKRLFFVSRSCSWLPVHQQSQAQASPARGFGINSAQVRLDRALGNPQLLGNLRV